MELSYKIQLPPKYHENKPRRAGEEGRLAGGVSTSLLCGFWLGRARVGVELNKDSTTTKISRLEHWMFSVPTFGTSAPKHKESESEKQAGTCTTTILAAANPA